MSDLHGAVLRRLAVYLQAVVWQIEHAHKPDEVVELGDRLIAIGLAMKHSKLKWQQRCLKQMAELGD